MLFGFLALSPVMLTRETYAARHATVLQNDWKGLLMIAVMNGFQIACNNASLTVMELSMNQVIRASIPVLVAVWEESRNALMGIFLTCLSCVMQSVQMSMS